MNPEKMSERLQLIMNRAVQIVTENQNSSVEIPHMVLAILEDDVSDAFLRKANINTNRLISISSQAISKLSKSNSNVMPQMSRDVYDALAKAEKWAFDLGDSFLAVTPVLIELLQSNNAVS